MKMVLIKTLAALGLAACALGAHADGPIRADEGIGFYVGVDGLATIASGTYAGLANPNHGRLTLLFDHGDHFHGIGAYSYSGTAGAPVVLPTNANNRLPEPYTRVDEAHSAIELVGGSGAWAGRWVSAVLPESAATHEYSFLGVASVQSLSGLSAAADVLYHSSGNRWSGVHPDVTVALRLDAVSSGLNVAVAGNDNVFAAGAGSSFALGGSNGFTFMPTFWTAGDAAPGVYTAQFTLLNLGSNGSVLDSGTFYFDLAVPVPEPQLWAMLLAGLAFVGFSRRRRAGAQGALG